jgi:hypothetical protein
MLTLVRVCDADGYRWEIRNEAGSVVDCALTSHATPEGRDSEASAVLDAFRHQEAQDARLQDIRNAERLTRSNHDKENNNG